MTDKVQKIREWINKEQDGLMDAQGNFEYPEHEGAFHILSNLDYYINSLQEESVSEDLEEAANEYCNTPAINNPPFAPTEFIKEAFKAGAQWQKQQTVEKAVEWLNSKQRGFILTEKDIEDFKRYMEK